MDNFKDIIARKVAIENEFVRWHIRQHFSWWERWMISLTWWLYNKYARRLQTGMDDTLTPRMIIDGEQIPFSTLEQDAALERLVRKRRAARRWRAFFDFRKKVPRADLLPGEEAEDN